MDAINDDNYATMLESFVSTLSLQVAQDNTKNVWGIDHFVLAKKWGILPKKTFNTIHHTTHHGVLHPSLSRQLRMKDHQLWYRRLPHNLYNDTLFATTVSRRGNRCAQIFATNFCWSCSFPMKLKSEAHKALSLLFQWDGVLLPKKWSLVSSTKLSRRHHVI